MYRIIVYILFICSNTLYGQYYSISLIPDSLIKNANASVRKEELKVTILSESKAVVVRKYAITIFNESGEGFSTYNSLSSNLESIKNIKGNLYDFKGNLIKSLRKSDIQDYAYNSNVSLITDLRVKQYSFHCKSYPYTVEYEEELQLNGIFFLPRWEPVLDKNILVQYSRFVVETPVDYKLRYKQICYNGKPQIVTRGNSVFYTWEVKNLKAITNEFFMPDLREVTPNVTVTPERFEIEGYKGKMSSWQELGKFIWSLNAGRSNLPENIKVDVHRLTDGILEREKKIKILYEYLQKNTRYVGIQLGIGGWQCFEASYVATNGYGDCKALSNYMVSLLKEVGISSNYVLVNSGKFIKDLWEDFPAPYFNHAIVCVPNGKDSLWLECTSQTESAGYLGSWTGNRKALLIAEDGGYLVATPKYTANENVEVKKIEAEVNESGNLKAKITSHSTGIKQEEMHSLFHGLTKEERERYLKSIINLPNYKIENLEYKETRGLIPEMDEFLSITSENYAIITGKRLFIEPIILNKNKTRLESNDKRQFDIENLNSYLTIDSINIKIPDGYFVESMPKDVSIDNKFGVYEVKFKFDKNSIEVFRRYERKTGRHSKISYNELLTFFDLIYKSDRSRVVLVKKD